MKLTKKPTDEEELARARVELIIPEESDLEDMPLEIDKEDIEFEGRKPDLGETEDDTSEL